MKQNVPNASTHMCEQPVVTVTHLRTGRGCENGAEAPPCTASLEPGLGRNPRLLGITLMVFAPLKLCVFGEVLHRRLEEAFGAVYLLPRTSPPVRREPEGGSSQTSLGCACTGGLRSACRRAGSGFPCGCCPSARGRAAVASLGSSRGPGCSGSARGLQDREVGVLQADLLSGVGSSSALRDAGVQPRLGRR